MLSTGVDKCILCGKYKTSMEDLSIYILKYGRKFLIRYLCVGVDEIVTKILDSVEGILRYANFNVRYT